MANSKLGKFLFHNTTTSQTIAKNTFWLSFGEIFGRFLRVILIFSAARILGVAGWGTFSYMVSMAAILTVFSDIGLTSIVVREGSKNSELRKTYFATSLFLKLILIFLSFLLIVFVTPRISDIGLSPILVYAVGFLMVFDALRVFGNSIFRSEQQMQFEAGTNIFTQVSIFSLGFYVLLRNPSPELLAVAYAAGSGIGLLVITFLIRKYIKVVFKYFRRDIIKNILAYSWPIGFSAIFGGLMVNIDTVMVGWFRDATHVGLYAAAQKPIAFLYLLPALIAGALFPVLAKRAEKDKDGFRKVLENGVAATLLVAYPIVVGLLMTADQIVNFVYGQDYLLSAGPLRILAMTLIITFPSTIIVHAFIAYNRQKELVPLWTMGTIFNILTNFMLIPIFGIVGAAWTSFFTQVGVNTVLWRKMIKINPFVVHRRMKTILLASLLMALAVMITRSLGLHVLLTVGVACAVYFASLLALKDHTLLEIKSIIRTQ